MNVDLVWLLDPKEKLISSFENDTDDARYRHPASDRSFRKSTGSRRSCARYSTRRARCASCRSTACPTSSRATPVLHSDRSGPAAGTLVFRRGASPRQRSPSIGADTQLNVHFALLDDRSIAAEKARPARGAGRPSHRAPLGQRDRRPAAARLDRQPARSPVLATTPATLGHAERSARCALSRRLGSPADQHRRRRRGTRTAVASSALRCSRDQRNSLSRDLRSRRVGIVLFDPSTRRILDANPQAQRLVGASLDELRRRDVVTIFDTPVSLVPGNQVGDVADSRPAQVMRGDGERRDVEFSIAELDPGTGRVHAMLLQDISHRREAERRAQEHQLSLQHLATHDALTGLPNRTYLNEELPRLIDEAARRGDSLSILYIDCDNFKNINDSRGHSIGDDYLRSVARRLRDSIASPDLGRAHGRRRVSRGHTSLRARARQRGYRRTRRRGAQEARAASARPPTPPPPASDCPSIPRDATTMSELLRSADIALYEAKARGRDNVQMFDAAMNKRVHTRLALEQDLRSAVNRDAIEIHLQPIVDIRSGRLVSFEALARWNDPRHGAVPPLAFIEVGRSLRSHRRARRMRVPQRRTADRRLAARGPEARCPWR
jgi:PAS domain S-box-containing protein